MPREKSRYRDRRSTSNSSDSSRGRKKSKRRRRLSRSRDRSESSSYRKRRSTSRSKHKRRSYSRSVSRDRYERSRRRSASRSRSKRDRSHSRSSSSSKKYKSSKKSRKRSRSSSSRSSSFDIGPLNTKTINLDDTETKIEKAIKAAEAAGLTLTKIPTYEYKEVEIREDMPTIQDRNLLAELNSDSFIQKPFISRKKDSKNIVIDLNTQTVKLPESDIKVKDESIIDFNEIPSEEELTEMWIKKLYQYRKRLLKGEM